jgi:hypothetical protein
MPFHFSVIGEIVLSKTGIQVFLPEVETYLVVFYDLERMARAVLFKPLNKITHSQKKIIVGAKISNI